MYNIPSRFISFTITFIADDKIIEQSEIKYGEPTAMIKYPEVPAKDGHFGHWQITDDETVTENIDIYFEYFPYITVLASAEKNENGKLSLALCEGEFDDTAELHITESSINPPNEINGNIKFFDISLLNTSVKDDETVTLRILNENKSKITAWTIKDGRPQKIKTSDRGKYIKLQTNGTNNTICLKFEEKSHILSVCILLSLVLIGGVAVFKKKFSKK